MVLDCFKNKTPHSELKLHNYLEPTFVPPTVQDDFPYSAPIKGKRTNSTHVPEQYKDNGLMNDELLRKYLLKLETAANHL